MLKFRYHKRLGFSIALPLDSFLDSTIAFFDLSAIAIYKAFASISIPSKSQRLNSRFGSLKLGQVEVCEL